MSTPHPSAVRAKKDRSVPVACFCGWRSKRVMGECACYDEWALYCACHWGHCPKCNGRVMPLDRFKHYKEVDGQLHAPRATGGKERTP